MTLPYSSNRDESNRRSNFIHGQECKHLTRIWKGHDTFIQFSHSYPATHVSLKLIRILMKLFESINSWCRRLNEVFDKFINEVASHLQLIDNLIKALIHYTAWVRMFQMWRRIEIYPNAPANETKVPNQTLLQFTHPSSSLCGLIKNFRLWLFHEWVHGQDLSSALSRSLQGCFLRKIKNFPQRKIGNFCHPKSFFAQDSNWIN